MKKFAYAAALAMLAAPAMAGTAQMMEVPEMGAGAGLAAIALIAGVAAIIRERTKR